MFLYHPRPIEDPIVHSVAAAILKYTNINAVPHLDHTLNDPDDRIRDYSFRSSQGTLNVRLSVDTTEASGHSLTKYQLFIDEALSCNILTASVAPYAYDIKTPATLLAEVIQQNSLGIRHLPSVMQRLENYLQAHL